MKFFTIYEEAEATITEYSLRGTGVGMGALGLTLLPTAGMSCGDLADRMTPHRHWHLVPERHPRDRQALVVVATSAGVGGELWLTSNCQEEYMEKGRVIRRSKPLEQAVGVTLLGSSAETNHKVLLLAPGASFKICRNGQLEGAPPELTVLWTGRTNPNDATAGMKVYGRQFRTGYRSPDGVEAANDVA